MMQDNYKSLHVRIRAFELQIVHQFLWYLGFAQSMFAFKLDFQDYLALSKIFSLIQTF